MADNKKAVNFLPEYLKTDKNSKFLSATIDPLIQSPQLERIDGFVGSKITPNYNPSTDSYIGEDSALRSNYSLEPALVFKDASSNITDVVSYDDIINEINIQGGKTNDLDRIFRTKFYSYNPYIEWDKLINHSQYYWLPTGPDFILIDDEIDVENEIIGKTSYLMLNGYNLSNGMKIKFSSKVSPSDYQENEYYVEGVGKNIYLVLVDDLVVNESIALVYNETFDGELFDFYPFDGDTRLPLTPEYVTINRSSIDLNPWSRYNRWFHGEIIRITAEINKQSPIYPLKFRAQRPIIEFKPNIKLFNFGTNGLKNVDLIDNNTVIPFLEVNGTFGYYVDNILLENGQRVIFNAASDPLIRSRIYKVRYTKSTNSPMLYLDLVSTANNLDSVEVNFGDIYNGTSWYYNGNNWVKSQQHTTINQAPLFDLVDSNGYSYGDQNYHNSNFFGSKIFGYEIGTVYDKILKLSVKYNNIGTGSYVFKNYFMSDTLDITENNITSSYTTKITYFKVNGEKVNVWEPAEDYRIPVVEVQTVTENTSTLQITSFDKLTNASVVALVNNSFTAATISNLTVTFEKTLKINDIVSLEITSNTVPNNNGVYKTPLSLTNNPLNGNITYMTLTEISDHVLTMISNIDNFVGNFPGKNNLRDLDDYSKYGKRLIINENPIVFAQTFLGKKEHNVVDAIRHVSNQYNQFKMNLLRVISNISSDLSPANALDAALFEINQNKDSHSPYYRSEMLGYGSDKIVRTYTVSSSTTIIPTGVTNFDLLKLSFQSILVYLNNSQLVLGKNYYIIDDMISFSPDTIDTTSTISIVYYPNTIGSFIPPTPSKLGLYPAYEPLIYTDDSYLSGEIDVIVGHDGSIVKTYDDYRDDIILEYEKRIYNNIKVKYDSSLFDINAIIPGEFRQDKYLPSDIVDLLTKDFINWTGLYNIDASTNDIVDEGDPLTWNYQGQMDIDIVGDKNSSVGFDGNSYLSIPSSPNLDFGTGDFTIEAWVYVQTADEVNLINTIIASVYGSSGLQFGFGYYRGSQQEFVDPSGVIWMAETDLQNETWTHVAIIRYNTIIALFQNGLIVGLAVKPEPMSLSANGSNTLIGAFYESTNAPLGAFIGNISNLRVVKGIALYLEDFIPGHDKFTKTQAADINGYPSLAIDDPAATVLLTLQDDTIIDNSVYSHIISSVGNISITQEIVPFGTLPVTLSGENVKGYWRKIYKNFYDTDRPHTHPWEMLGHSSKPEWWDTYYSWTDDAKRISLISAITNGYIEEPPSTKININYARPNFVNYIPVNRIGALLKPSPNTPLGYFEKKTNWKFGDQGPAETAWRRSSYWPFALNAAAALLYPSTYTSSLYDTSRIKLANVNTTTSQLVYKSNDLYSDFYSYLDISKLLVEGDVQTSGYGVYVVEKGLQKNSNYIDILKQDLTYLNLNLFHKLGGFASKDKLQILIDSVDPLSQAQGALLPPEDYTLLLNVSNPIKSASISGVIVQKYEGTFIVKGYDSVNSYFEILKPITQLASGTLTVGGKSEEFTEWNSSINNGNNGLTPADLSSSESNTTKYYKSGQVVRYNGRYYRVKVGHNAQSKFDTSLFYGLPSLPMVGGSTVQLSSKFESSVTRVSYGTIYSSIQEVYDLLTGYGAYLSSQGFIFDEFNSDLNEIVDWKYTGKEFLYWTTQNWADGSIITLSPFVDYLKYAFTDSVVDDISAGKYEYSLLKADGKSFPIDKFRLSRENGICVITTVDTYEGIFFAKLNSVQKEHGMVFNNKTIFNDTIYDIETGYKQRRIKISGFRTLGWNGDLSSPGFVYDNVIITDWKAYNSYLPGAVVRYNGAYYESNNKIQNDAKFNFSKWTKLKNKPESNLLPNFDYKINQFEDFYSLDIDNFDATQQQLAQHLIGYTPRTYLNNLFTNPTSQYKFYQGFIKDKGTKNAIKKLSKVGKFTRNGDISMSEDWAFRVGEYGSFSSFQELEFTLQEGVSSENPYINSLVDNIPADPNPLINYITPSLMLSTVPDAFNTYPGTYQDNNIELPTAGYVRTDDVTVTAYNKNSLLDIANNSLIKEGNTIWLGFLEDGGWAVYRYSEQSAKIAGVYVSAPGESITFTTDFVHGLSVGDIVSVVRFNSQVNGIYIVTDIPRLDQFTVSSTLTTIIDDTLLSYGGLFKFENVRYSNINKLVNAKNLLTVKYGEKVWIDNGLDGKWKVYEKTKNYSTVTNIFNTSPLPLEKKLGTSIYASDNTNIVLVSVPGNTSPVQVGVGSVWVLVKNNITGVVSKDYEYTLNNTTNTYCDTSVSSEFGFSLAYAISKKGQITGAPGASYVRGPSAPTGSVISWSPGTGNIRGYTSEGVVQISFRQTAINKLSTARSGILLNPYPQSNARFGHSIYINEVSALNTSTFLVGAPGANSVGAVYAYQLSPGNPRSHSQGIILASHVSLTSGSQFGHKIAGDSAGSIIAISAPGHTSTSYTGVVQLFNNNLSWVQTLTSPFGSTEPFGNDVAVSSDGLYIFISSINTKLENESYGKVAVYKKTIISDAYLATRSEVILALADNLLAPVYYGEETIINWMTVGLSGFDQFWIDYRASHPSDAAIYDAERAADAVNTVETRANVIRAYQNNPNAELYPKENNIRYWMLYGLGVSKSIFNQAVIDFNNANPVQHAINLSEREVAESLSDYVFALHQIINNPSSNYSLKFGNSISISGNNKTLAISSLGTNRSNVSKFDINSILSETIFDGGITRFIESIPDSGTVYVFNNVDGYFILGDELIDKSILPGSQYGKSVAVTNDRILVGAPSTASTGNDDSTVYQFDKLDTNVDSWKLLREQEDLVDPSSIKRITLIDNLNESVIEYLDVIDPLKGKIAGIASQELKYRSAFDPATYSIGLANNIVDSNTSWIDDHVGELWWDLSTVKYVWYEQGDEIFRKNNWGKLFPGSNIDVYEWVKSDLLPSEWAAQADTTGGLTKGISGQPKYPDNSSVSVKQLFNNVTNSFENVYYFWVKNKVTIPDVKNRRISSYQVSKLIADPISYGLKFAEILGASGTIAFANVQPSLIGDRISANISFDNINNTIPRHTEWLLLAEGNADDVPTSLLEKKLFDSLLGHDEFGNNVPDITLTPRNRYGIGIRPQQTLFKDRLTALRNLVDFANSVLIKNIITEKEYVFTNLNKIDPIPDIFSREYDGVITEITTENELNSFIDSGLFRQAILTCNIVYGKIASVIIVDSGYGYTTPPEVTGIFNGYGGIISYPELLTTINNKGQVISVSIENPGMGIAAGAPLLVRPHTYIIKSNSEYNGRWTKHVFNYNLTTETKWTRVKNQTYNTPLYWDKVDWVGATFNKFKDYNYTIPTASEIISLYETEVGDYVKINNIGDGTYAILEKVSPNQLGNFSAEYDLIYREKGTIQISEKIWNYKDSKYSYDIATLDETLYDQIPDLEVLYILKALKEDIFINDLKINWNLFFFTAVRYALTEQKLLDWAFKTSFINVVNQLGSLDQRPVYKLDNEKYYEDYVREVKPYHSNIRSYISKYTYIDDQFNSNSMDFDMPIYFNNSTQNYEIVTLANTSTINLQPWKSWADNYKYSVGSINVSNSGAGYTARPTVTISGGGTTVSSTATAEAYIRSGSVYQILVTDPGEGYTETPIVTLSGGGLFTTPATAAANLLNSTIRKNIIGLRFNRITTIPEINLETFTDTFTCSGIDDKFELSWLADPNKLNIIPTVSGKLILSTDYTIEYYTKDYNGYTKKYCRFVFLNYVPKRDAEFKISYNKSKKLYSAIDMIEKLYTGTFAISELMTGTVYPNTIVQGLPFNYSPVWDTYDEYDNNSVWSDNIGNYVSAKLIKNINKETSVLYLDSVEGIIPGQSINILGSPTNVFRTDTVVISVNSGTNSISINQPHYLIGQVKSTSTSIGTNIVVKTRTEFNNDIRVGDRISINISDNSFNGIYNVKSVIDTDKFIVTATSVLSTTTIYTGISSSATISTILANVNTGTVLLDTVAKTFVMNPSTSTYILDFNVSYKQVSKVAIRKNNEVTFLPSGIPVVGPYPAQEYYYISENTNGNVILGFYQMTDPSYYLDISFYTDPTLEFWNTSYLPSSVETIITSAFDVEPNFKTIDGDSFLNIRNGYAPEECVAGTVVDSLGINVYTKADTSYAMVYSGSFPVTTLAPFNNRFTLKIPFPAAATVMVHYNGTIFNQVENIYSLSQSNQYYMEDNTIVLAPQTVKGRAGYTIMTVGGNRSVLDSNMIVSSDSSVATIESLASIDDVRSAYVLVDGQEIEEVMSAGQYGYMIQPISNTNKRASVKIYNLSTPGTHTIEAWFFESEYTNFNRIHEEIFEVSDATSLFTLSLIPGKAEPASEQVIVELGTTTVKRLIPPSASYYKVANNQRIFNIDNKHTREPDTYISDNIFVYANGVKLKSGFEYSVNLTTSKITIVNGLLKNGDVIAIVGLIDGTYDYIVDGDILALSNPVGNNILRVISFTDHDNMMIRTEVFDGNPYRQFSLSLPILNDNYVWVYANGVPLTARVDFEILEDSKTIKISKDISITTATTDKVIVTSINPPSYGDQILGFRMFENMFGNLDSRRLSEFYSTTLSQPLRHDDTAIYVVNATKLFSPDPITNTPGVVLIDGERIEFFRKDGNILKQLRRSTLGTGPAYFSDIGTKVIDQSQIQILPASDEITRIQTTSTTATTYVISTVNNAVIGDGISFVNNVPAVDQVTVYYGGRQLRKSSLIVNDINISYDPISTSLVTLPPEFTITTATNTLILNINDYNGIKTDITIVQKKGYVWTGTNKVSLITSTATQAIFMRDKEAVLPDKYYYGG